MSRKIHQDILDQNEKLEHFDFFKVMIERSSTILFLSRYEEGFPIDYISDNISIFGYSSEEFTSGKLDWKQIVYEEDLERLNTYLNHYSHSEKSDKGFIEKYRIVSKDGNIFWVSDQTNIIRDLKGNITHVQGMFIDITEEKKLEDELNKYKENLEFLVEERTKQLEEANNKLQVQKIALEQKQITLRELLKQIELQNKQIKKDIAFNVNRLLLPVMKLLKKRSEHLEEGYIELLENTAKEISTSFAKELSSETINLTPREIEICNMIKNNISNKEIANLFYISTNAVEWHRYNIRGKFGLHNKKVNLTTFLQNMGS